MINKLMINKLMINTQLNNQIYKPIIILLCHKRLSSLWKFIDLLFIILVLYSLSDTLGG